MLGILVELALSWIIVWIVEKKNLTVLGLNATAPRLKGFTLKWLRFSRGPIGNGVFISPKNNRPPLSLMSPPLQTCFLFYLLF